ncbi:MAG: ABC transporter ATP-binding protein [Clostridia bacterium]|nr:ABC transporter ATP-binding protein [Clostridia bacterium]
MSEAFIQLKGIAKSYGKNEVLKGVDMTVNQGDIYGLIGKNGSGKTTLFKVILGLSPYQAGEMSLFGAANEAQNRANRKRIGFFIGANFFGYLSGRENLDYYRRVKGIRDKSEIDRVLGIVGLDEKQAKSPAARYSLGQKQRLGIANALLGKPELLIFDEPTNGLDPQGIHDIRTLIQKINAEEGTTIIVSSHILSELEHTAHRFGIVHDGVIKREITREEMNRRNKTVRIDIADSNSDKAKAVLEQNGIEVYNIARKDSSLEEFYFELVGGEENV